MDSRIVAALRFHDATVGHVITTPLRVTGDGVRILRNRSSVYVITQAPGFEDYVAAFRDPTTPGATTLTLGVRDPSHRYLPRSIALPLPRDVDPAHLEAPQSIWQPLRFALYPSPTGSLGTGWATLRLSIKRAGSDDGLPFAYVRVVRDSDDALIGVGLSDHRGEALVAVAGVPVTSWNAESTSTSPIVTTIGARVTAYYDATAYDEAAGRFPDPDALEDRFSTLPHSNEETFELASGQTRTRRIDVSLS
ncbi:MAG: hypothetical protein DIU78_016470 [Pseudomonadota bacterium]